MEQKSNVMKHELEKIRLFLFTLRKTVCPVEGGLQRMAQVGHFNHLDLKERLGL